MKTLQELSEAFQAANLVHIQAVDKRREAKIALDLADRDLTKAKKQFDSAEDSFKKARENKRYAGYEADNKYYILIKGKADGDTPESMAKSQEAFDVARSHHIALISDERIAEFEKDLSVKEYSLRDELCTKARYTHSAAEQVEAKAANLARKAFDEFAKRQLEETGKLDLNNKGDK